MESKQEERARQMAELQSHADHLQHENDCLRARLEGERIENTRGSSHPAPTVKQNKGKEPIRSVDNDATVNDELSFGSSSLPDLPPPKNNVEAELRKWPPLRSSRSVRGVPHWVRREFNRERRQSEHSPENVPAWQWGTTPSLSFGYPTFGAAPGLYILAPTAVRGLEDMLSSPLGQHILSYKSPCGFVIPSFSRYDGSSDLYDHMLHFNQAMILNAGDDRQLCKVFSASLKGPTLAWFYKLPRGFISAFSELWAAFISQYLCSVGQKGNINSL